jgi:hypothetical protein
MFEPVAFDQPHPSTPIIVVNGEIGGTDRDLRVVIDSGGGGPVGIYIAQSLGEVSGVTLGEAQQITPPFGGQPVILRTGTVSSITIAGVTLANAAIGQSDIVDRLSTQLGTEVHAIVGHHFLASRIVSIDYAARQIDLTASAGSADEAIPVRPTPEGRHMLVRARVNEHGPYTLLLDTGSTRTHVSPQVARQVRMPTGGISIVQGAGGTTRVPTGPARVAVGSHEVALAPVLISNELAAISVRSGTRVDGILGADWLAGLRVTIDYPGGRLWIRPGRQPSPPSGPTQ